MSNQKQDIVAFTENITDDWKNFPVCEINDHVVRVSVLQKDFYWHSHSKSDEFFFVVEGELFVDFEDRTETLTKGQMIKVPKDVLHRTRSNMRTTILCFESTDNDVTGDANEK
ncbi:cupin domain-containing protein [uncultured Dokdonia sp.]|uniref:cupin domain-containing protein n=1 Tax=uncultured Dokdonia sp. TaxID=575653 RepID=UPI002622A62E|nr:cupin domain-containing protein [uncultured Dokdonia sp.]